MPVVQDPFILFAPSLVETIMPIGYIEGDYTNKVSGSTGMWACYDGIISKTNVQGGLTIDVATEVSLGYDFSFQFPLGIKIDKVEVWGANNHGYINTADPTDTKIKLECWDGVWNACGDTGLFTDGTTSDMRTITSTDQTTLFTRIRLLTSTATSALRLIAAIKIYEVGGGIITVPVFDGNNVTPGIGVSWGRGEEFALNTASVLLLNSLLTVAATTSDFVIPFLFDKPRSIDKVNVHSSTDHGFIFNTDPADVQIDLEGLISGSPTALGDTGIFTDSNSLSKEIDSSDKTTLYDGYQIRISTATSAFRVCSASVITIFA